MWSVASGIIGVVIGGISIGIVALRMSPFQKSALQELAKSQEAALKSKDSHIHELEARYKETIEYHTELYTKMELERNNYREELHHERNERGSDKEKIASLEARPDLGTIEGLIKGQTEALKGISGTLTNHVESDAKIFGGIQSALAAIPAALKAQSDSFRDGLKEQDRAFTERQQKVIRLLKRRP